LELIDKKAALKAIYLAGEAIKEYSGRFYEGKFNGLQCAYEIINDMPAEERKHGHWKGKSLAGYCTVRCSCICSVCKNSQEYETKYCPECGAKMDGDNNVK
jgi:hypothetical protein